MTNRNLKGLVGTVALAALLAGCGTLIPKKVEFFQSKVQALPEKPDTQVELEKEVAYAATLTARLTTEAAVSNHSPVSVIAPAKATETLTSAVSVSLGPPKSVPAIDTATNLAVKLVEKSGSLDAKVEKYADKIAPLVGKKIEGTGFIRIPYFLYIGIVIAIVFVIWTGLKIYGAANPIVGLGTNIVGRVGSKTVSLAASELAKGGELFKEELAKSGIEQAVTAKVETLFRHSQERAQSETTKEVVKTLTQKPTQ